MGLLDPATEDGRVIFILPWLGSTLVGTTDHLTEIRGNNFILIFFILIFIFLIFLLIFFEKTRKSNCKRRRN